MVNKNNQISHKWIIWKEVMAIAITEGCMDEVGNSTVCKHILT